MIVDRTHIKWGIGTALATVAVTLVYLANDQPEVLRKVGLDFPLPDWLGPVPPLRGNVGATPLGLIYGTIALLIFLFAALLGWRRSNKTAPVGRIQLWLKAHIWLTIFTIPLVVFHCGFHGGGPMSQVLLSLYAFVMVSGFWGLTLQHIIPKLMRDYLPEETIFEEIPFIRTQLIEKAESIREELASLPDEPVAAETQGEGGTATQTISHRAAAKSVIQFIDDEGLPYLKILQARRFALRDRQTSDNQFRLLKLQVPPFIQPLVEQFQELCDEKRQLDRQSRLHYWLHGWLLVHAPASILLVVLTIVHAIVATYLYA
jgi:hypothetical protein